jgi:hypothetical protein
LPVLSVARLPQIHFIRVDTPPTATDRRKVGQTAKKPEGPANESEVIRAM